MPEITRENIHLITHTVGGQPVKNLVGDWCCNPERRIYGEWLNPRTRKYENRQWSHIDGVSGECHISCLDLTPITKADELVEDLAAWLCNYRSHVNIEAFHSSLGETLKNLHRDKAKEVLALIDKHK